MHHSSGSNTLFKQYKAMKFYSRLVLTAINILTALLFSYTPVIIIKNLTNVKNYTYIDIYCTKFFENAGINIVLITVIIIVYLLLLAAAFISGLFGYMLIPAIFSAASILLPLFTISMNFSSTQILYNDGVSMLNSGKASYAFTFFLLIAAAAAGLILAIVYMVKMSRLKLMYLDSLDAEALEDYRVDLGEFDDEDED